MLAVIIGIYNLRCQKIYIIEKAGPIMEDLMGQESVVIKKSLKGTWFRSASSQKTAANT